MNYKQKQALLFYLGFYKGSLDGIWGPKSTRAAKDFLDWWRPEPGLSLEEALVGAVGNSNPSRDIWAECKNFTREEFRCKCGGRHCDGFPAEPDENLVRLAQAVRDWFTKPVLISSGLRCQAHNAAVGGVANSRHLTGKAIDFCVPVVKSQKLLEFINDLPGVRYAYAIDGLYVHMDVE